MKGYSLVVFFLFVITVPLYADESNWYENIFFTVSGQYYIIPDFAGAASPELAQQYGISTGIFPYIGFRIGAGYQWNRWSFALESGYSYIRGDNPLVKNINLTPLLLKTGYSFYPISEYDRFSLTPTIALGIVFAGTDHYKDAIDILTDNITRSENTGFLLQPGVRASWNPFVSGKILEVFAAFSLDCIIEQKGIIPLPQIELGVIIRPFVRTGTTPAANVIHEEKIEEVIIESIIEEEIIESIIEPIEEIREWKRESLLILFGSDSFTLTEEGQAVLDRAAAAFKEYREAKIILRGYAAPYPSVWGQTELSRQRALFCAAYLMEKHNITFEDIRIEWMGSGSLPEDIEENNIQMRRSVEITIEGWIQ